MKKYYNNTKEWWDKTTWQFRAFFFFVLVVIILTIGFICNKKELPPPTVVKQPVKEKVLSDDVSRLNKKLVEAEKELAICREENEGLKDSLYVLEQKPPVVVTAPVPPTQKPKTASRRKVSVPCNCPTAFGYYRNRGSASSTKAMTKKYCKIHGTRK